MALPLIMAGGMAGLQALSIREQNKQVAEQLKQNVTAVKDNFNTQIGQLQELAESRDSDIALEMSANRYKGLRNTASTSVAIAERGVAGNSASRLYDNTLIMQMMSHNALAKKAEENAVNFGVEMENKRREANSAINRAVSQAASNTISPIQAISKIAGAGMQGYAMGSALAGAGGANAGGSGVKAVGSEGTWAQSYGSQANWENDIFE